VTMGNTGPALVMVVERGALACVPRASRTIQLMARRGEATGGLDVTAAAARGGGVTRARSAGGGPNRGSVVGRNRSCSCSSRVDVEKAGGLLLVAGRVVLAQGAGAAAGLRRRRCGRGWHEAGGLSWSGRWSVAAGSWSSQLSALARSSGGGAVGSASSRGALRVRCVAVRCGARGRQRGNLEPATEAKAVDSTA